MSLCIDYQYSNNMGMSEGKSAGDLEKPRRVTSQNASEITIGRPITLT